MERVGAFICTGCEIGEAFDVEKLTEPAEENGAKAVVNHPCLCAPEGIEVIKKTVEDEKLDGVLIAACSPRVKVKEFNLFDPSKVPTFRVALREHVAWTQPAGEEDTELSAVDMIGMGTTRVAKMEIPKELDGEIDETVLVVGGGLTGLTAAKAAVAMGQKVTLVEKTDGLGGYLKNVKALVPDHPPYNLPAENNVPVLVQEIEAAAEVTVHLSSTIKSITGQPGQFNVTLENGTEFKAGAIVQATGARPYDASRLEHLGYGASPDVITSTDLEKMLSDGAVVRPSNGNVPSTVTFVQCAGSRDKDHLPYCSSECCATSVKQVACIQKDFPDINCVVVYRDMRTPGQLERFYSGVQENGGATFTCGEAAKVSTGGGKLAVEYNDDMLKEQVSIDSDLVVLATGMVPNSADSEAIRELMDSRGVIEKNESETQVASAKEKVEKLARHDGTAILNLDYRQGPDLPVLQYEFPDSHYICFPYETRRTGILAAGSLHSPMDAAQAIEDAYGATTKAVQCIEALKRGETVHPRAGDKEQANFFLQSCTNCKRCTEECPFGAINEDAKGTPEYNELRCRRCGICLGACPERIISFPSYSVDGIASMIKAFEVPDEDDEKPRIIALMCENDALPALDEAAANRVQISPWIRIVPVRCLGACNTVWIADSLSRGIDGVILIGCKKGDDYQCHYIRGSELASTRMSNVQETLTRLSLESERVEVVELARDEFSRVPEILNAFAETIDDVGPNPFKGF